MSVAVNLRTNNQLVILDMMRQLVVYTYERTQKPITKDNEEKSGDFPKIHRRLANQIWDTCYNADKYISMANDYIVHSNDDYKERRRLQLLGRCEFKQLPRLIAFAYDMGIINSHRFDVWIGLMANVETKIDNWIRENEERFSKG